MGKFKKKFLLIISFIVIIFIIMIYLIITPNNNVAGTYYGEGDFGSIEIIVSIDTDMIKYYFDFTDKYKQEILEANKYHLQFVANKEFNISRSTTEYTEDNVLLSMGLFRGHINKPFTLFNIRINSDIESVNLQKVE